MENITYETEKERLTDEMMYLMEKVEWPYIKECFASYCDLDDEDKIRIIELDKKLQLSEESRLYTKDEVILCTAFFLNNEKDLCKDLNDEELLLFSKYYSYSGVANEELGRNKKELFKLACTMRKEENDRMEIVQLGENLLADRDYAVLMNTISIFEKKKLEKSGEEKIHYINKLMNSEVGKNMARRVRL